MGLVSPSRRLLAHLIPYRAAFLQGLGCVVAASALQLAAPWVMKYAIDDLIAQLTAEKISGYAAGILALSAASGWFRFQARRIIVGVSREFEYALRNEFFAHLQRRPPEPHLRIPRNPRNFKIAVSQRGAGVAAGGAQSMAGYKREWTSPA